MASEPRDRSAPAKRRARERVREFEGRSPSNKIGAGNSLNPDQVKRGSDHVTATDLVDRLAAHKTVGGAPREELAWLAAHGSLRHLREGEVLSAKGAPVASLFVVLTGRLAIFLDRGAGRHKAMEWRPGDVTGMLPYSRLVSPPADSVAQEDIGGFRGPSRRSRSDDSRVPRDHDRSSSTRWSIAADNSRRAACRTRRWCRSASCPLGWPTN